MTLKQCIFARKGDLILVARVNIDYVIETGRRESTDYTFGIVASATRDGTVKTWWPVGYGDNLVSESAQKIGHGLYWVMSRTTIDVEGVLKAAKTHHWPDHPGQPQAFNSFDEAREAARPFVRRTVEAA